MFHQSPVAAAIAAAAVAAAVAEPKSRSVPFPPSLAAAWERHHPARRHGDDNEGDDDDYCYGEDLVRLVLGNHWVAHHLGARGRGGGEGQERGG